MPNVLRSRTARSERWPLWIAGALAGVLASLLLLRPRASGAGEPRSSATPSARDARGARGHRTAPPDLSAITERMRSREGTQGLSVRSLGGGILEVVGDAPDELDLPAVLQALAAEPGVSVVVNRAWTSRSGAP
jgi:hypothetical protein